MELLQILSSPSWGARQYFCSSCRSQVGLPTSAGYICMFHIIKREDHWFSNIFFVHIVAVVDCSCAQTCWTSIGTENKACQSVSSMILLLHHYTATREWHSMMWVTRIRHKELHAWTCAALWELHALLSVISNLNITSVVNWCLFQQACIERTV